MSAVTFRPPPECAEVVRSLWEYLDRRVEPESVLAIESHLARCDGCRALADFEKRIMRTLAGLRGRHRDPSRLREEVLAVLRDARADDEGFGTGRSPSS